MDENFRVVALALRPFISDTYDLLAAADAISALFPYALSEHEMLVSRALTSSDVMDFVRNDQKIKAIKQVKVEFNTSLLVAKDVIEDVRIAKFAPSYIAAR